MKDVESPIKDLNLITDIILIPGVKNSITVEYSPNEFVSHEDYIGLFTSEPEPYTYFSLFS